jgi:L,D-transpeptidase catalytic domain
MWRFRLLFAIPLLLLASCVHKDKVHRIVVSVADQALEVRRNEHVIGRYPVSTSKFGLGDQPGHGGTPLGRLAIARKIGNGAPLGAVFRDRRPTGEVLKPDAPGRDPIVTRILWLKGLEPENRNAFDRYIYIHGTAEERNVGRPVSYGCIRMKSKDVVRVYNTVGIGAEVDIILGPLPEPVTPAPAKQPVAAATAQPQQPAQQTAQTQRQVSPQPAASPAPVASAGSGRAGAASVR